MKYLFPVVALFFITSILKAQNLVMDSLSPLPYAKIESYPDDYSPNSVLLRMIDGLGYRYYWATEGLRKEDLAYEPGNDGASCTKLIAHLYGLSEVVYNSIRQVPNDRTVSAPEMTFAEYRKQTLHNLKTASDLLRNNKDLKLEECTVKFKRQDQVSESSFWHLLNGPLADAIYHTGQVVSYRRTTGNPVNPLMNVFMGKNREPKK